MTAIPAQALDLIKEFEGLRLQAYQDTGGVWTIGYGHTRTARSGMKISAERAVELLNQDAGYAAEFVGRSVKVDLNANQLSALISFVFNVGSANFSASTLLRLLNRGWYEQVPTQLLRWTKDNGKELPGLVRRRKAEAALWNEPVAVA